MKRTFLSILVLAAVLMAACVESNLPTPVVEPASDEAPSNTVTAEGTLLPASSAELAFAQGGVVSEILVQPGDKVKKGDVIVRLVGIESVQTELAAARLELAASEKALDDLIEARDSEFAEAVIRLKELQKDYDRAEDYLTYLQTNLYVPQANLEVKRKESQQLGFYYENKFSFFKGPATSDMILEARNDLALHKAELDMAQHDYDLLKDGPDAEQLPILEARINAARANAAAAEAAMELYELRAPFAGTVLSHDLAVGETAPPMTPVAFVADTSRWIVKTKDLLVGQMRDLETVETALLAAETGHLVFSTQHTLDAPESVNRIIAVFPPHQQRQVRIQLASVLRAVISQRLMPRSGGLGRCAAVEVMIATPFIRDCIVDKDKTHLISGAIAAGTSQYGMQTFDQSIFSLYEKKLVSYEESLRFASNKDEFKLRVQGISTTTDMRATR